MKKQHIWQCPKCRNVCNHAVYQLRAPHHEFKWFSECDSCRYIERYHATKEAVK